MDKKVATIDIKECNLLKAKADIFDLIRDRDLLNAKIAQINQVCTRKAKRIERVRK